MKINTKIVLKGLDGVDLQNFENKPLTIGESLGNIIVSHEIGGRAKLYSLGVDLFKKEELEVDSADLILLKEAVEKTKVYSSAVVTGQLLVLLENIRDTKKA